MKEIKTSGIKDNAYLAILSARAYGNCTGHLGGLKHDNSLGYIDDLAYFAIATGNENALVELLDIAPNYYAENKTIKEIVNNHVQRGGDYATCLHLKAQREYAIATAFNKNPELSTEENNNLVKNAIRNKHSLSNKLGSLHSEIIQLSMSQASVEQINNKITEYEETQKAYNEINKMPNIAMVEKCFIDARNAYLEQTKNTYLEDALICKANAHIIAKDFGLQGEEKGMGAVKKAMRVSLKLNPTLAVSYYLNRCEFVDEAITQREYESRMMHVSDSTLRSANFMCALDVGYKICLRNKEKEQAMQVYQSTNDVLEDDKKARQTEGKTLHEALNEYANSVSEIGNRKNVPNINNKTFEESLEFVEDVLADSTTDESDNSNAESQDSPVSE